MVAYANTLEDRQRYFDVTVQHFADQRTRAVYEDQTACAYLNEDGLKCAVGVHIPDRHRGQMEKCTVSTLARLCPDLQGTAWPLGTYGLRLAEALQDVHDEQHNWGPAGTIEVRMLDDLSEVAEAHGLNFTMKQRMSLRDIEARSKAAEAAHTRTGY